MVSRIVSLLERFRQDWTAHLSAEAIRNACRRAGHVWRERTLDPVTTIHLFLLQVLHGNTPCGNLPHLSGLTFTETAYGKARARIPREAFQLLLRQMTQHLQQVSEAAARWRGHRVFHVDGSGFTLPDTPELRDHFGLPGGQRVGCGFPVAHALVLIHARAGFLLRVLDAPLRRHDASQAAKVHPELQPGDVLVGDRAFCSYAHLALLFQRQVQAVLRIHQRQIVDFTPRRPHAVPGKKASPGLPHSRWVKRLGKEDQWVEWLRPTSRPEWMSREQFRRLPEKLLLRELRVRIVRRGWRTKEVTLVTTLLDPKRYPAREVAELYVQRWQVETNLRHLKQTLKMDQLRCETVEGVLKELAMFAIAYNLVRLAMHVSAWLQQVAPERISFVDALRWLCAEHSGKTLGNLKVNPLRPGRYEPRVRKRRPKQFPLMKKPREELRKEFFRKQVAA
jgi:hypothetical protein